MQVEPVSKVSIHTLHELEARLTEMLGITIEESKSFHSYASRIGSKTTGELSYRDGQQTFPFIRFTNWKQEKWNSLFLERSFYRLCFHSYASRIGSKQMKYSDALKAIAEFPFIRFTNWKQELFGPQNNYGPQSFHSYASRIGSK